MDIYAEITNRMIAEMEQGIIPWKKPWMASGSAISHTTGKASINVQLAEKTGFSEEDAEIIKECLRTLFVNDASSARPDGSMEVYRLYWFRHSCKDGQYSSAKVHRSVHVALKNEDTVPSSVDDYQINVEEVPGLTPEIIEGL